MPSHFERMLVFDRAHVSGILVHMAFDHGEHDPNIVKSITGFP
jgi:hypothetical protein